VISPPLHARLTRSLLHEISSGNHPEGGRFLSNRAIAREWGVNQWTVDRSLRYLVENEVVAAFPRSGYRVAGGGVVRAMVLGQLHKIPALPKVGGRSQTVTEWLTATRKRRRLAVLVDSPRLWLHRQERFETKEAIASPSVAALWNRFCREAAQRGDQLECLEVPAQQLRRATLERYLDLRRWDGAIFIRRTCYPEAFQAAMGFFKEISLPCVTIFEQAREGMHPCVNVNYAGLGYEAVLALARSGVGRIVILDNLKGQSDSRELRLQGSALALAENGAAPVQGFAFRMSHEAADPVPPEVLDVLEESRRLPTGIVIFNRQLFAKIETELSGRHRDLRPHLSVVCNERPLHPSTLVGESRVMQFDYEAIAGAAYESAGLAMEGRKPPHKLLNATLR